MQSSSFSKNVGQTGSGYLAALIATMIWGGNFVTARAVAWDMPPCQFNFWRWFVAFVVILPFSIPHLRQDLHCLRRHFGYLSIMALLGVTLMNTFVYKAGQTAESLNMALLMPASPLVILILARIFYGEIIKPARLAGMCVAFAGVLILVSRGDLHRLYTLDIGSGDLWTMGCMICFATYSLLMRQRPKEISSTGFNVIIFGLGLLYAIPTIIMEMLWLPPPVWGERVYIGILYAGLGCSAIAFWLWTYGIDRVGPVRAGIIYYSLPVFAAIMAKIVLDENVNPAQITGGSLIIAGIFMATAPPLSLLKHKKGSH